MSRSSLAAPANASLASPPRLPRGSFSAVPVFYPAGHPQPEHLYDYANITLLEAIVIEVLAGRGSIAAMPRWLVRARRQIDDSGGCGVRVAELAARLGVHRVHLSRSFRRHFGLSVTDYVRRLRIRRAARMPVEACRIARVARAPAFADTSHFCRQFKPHAGVRPSDFRRLRNG